MPTNRVVIKCDNPAELFDLLKKESGDHNAIFKQIGAIVLGGLLTGDTSFSEKIVAKTYGLDVESSHGVELDKEIGDKNRG